MKRPYQQDAEDGIFARFSEGHNSTLVVMPTGTGKTYLFAHAIKRWLNEGGVGDALVLAHREELIFQARDELATILGFVPGIEMGELSVAGLSLFDRPRVVIGSVQTMFRAKRLNQFDPDRFGLIVVDEAHHATSLNRTYANILRRFDGAKLVGVTATPRRADDVTLGQFFQSVAYEYHIAGAIEDGWLVPVKQKFVEVAGLDFSVVGTLAGDLNQGELDAQMRAKRGLYEQCAAIVATCGEEPTLVFTVSVEHGLELAHLLNDHKIGSAVCLHGGTEGDERRRQLERFERGEFQYLLGCALFTEGFNCPRISRVVMARPTKSIVYYTQAIGRGTRTLRGVLTPDLADADARKAAIASSAKPELLVLDFVGNSGRHKLLSTVDVLGGTYPDEVKDRAKRKLKKKPDESVARLLEDAKKEIDRERAEAAERAEKRARARQARLNAQAQVRQTDVSPFERGHAPIPTPRLMADGRIDPKGPMTAEQRDFISRHGVLTEMSCEDARKAIADIRLRWERKLCTPRQARQLERFGYDPNTPKAWASVLMSVLAARSWKPLPGPITREQLRIAKTAAGCRVTVNDPVAGAVPVGPEFSSIQAARDYFLPYLDRQSATLV